MTYIEIFVLLATIVGFVASWITIYEWAKNNLTAQQTADLGEFLSGHEEEEQKREKAVVETVPPQTQQQQQTTTPAKEKLQQKHIHSENWADYFIQIFDSFFRPKGQFLISPWRSIIATTIGLFLCASLVTALGGIEVWAKSKLIIALETKGVSIQLLGIFTLIIGTNYLADWISLSETRVLMSFYRKLDYKYIGFILLLFADYIFTLMLPGLIALALLFSSAALYYGVEVTSSLKFYEGLYNMLTFPIDFPAVCVLENKPPLQSTANYKDVCSEPFLLVPLMTTFITTFWFIMFAIATWVARGPMKWFRGSHAQTIKNPFAVLVIIFSVMSFLLLSLIPLSLLWR